MTNTWTSTRARVASLTRSRPSNDPELVEARQQLAALNIKRYAEKIMAEAPPLSVDQVNAITSALTSRSLAR